MRLSCTCCHINPGWNGWFQVFVQFSGIWIVLVSSQLFLALPSKSDFFSYFSGKSPTFGRSTAKSAWNLWSQPFICTLLCSDEATSGSGSTATARWRRLPWKAGGFSDENKIDLPYKKLKRWYHILYISYIYLFICDLNQLYIYIYKRHIFTFI